MKIIQYQLLNCSNIGTEEAPVWVEAFVEKTPPYSLRTEEIAKNEAYNGVYTVEEREEQPAALTMEERLSRLEKTYAAAPFSAGTWYYRGGRVLFEGETYVCIAPDKVVCVWDPNAYPAYWQKN